MITYTPFTRYNRLSKRFDNRVERTVAVRSTGCQTTLYNRIDNWLYTRYSRLSSRFDNRLYRVNGAIVCPDQSEILNILELYYSCSKLKTWERRIHMKYSITDTSRCHFAHGEHYLV